MTFNLCVTTFRLHLAHNDKTKSANSAYKFALDLLFYLLADDKGRIVK